MGWIYCWKSKTSGKRYIGLTTEGIMERWERHIDNATKLFESYKKYQRSPFYRAIRKYGVNDFELEFTYEYMDDLLDDYEIFYIMYYNTTVPNGYNISKGGLNTPWENNKFYLIDAETNTIIMHANRKYMALYFNCKLEKLLTAAYKTKHFEINGKLYHITKEYEDTSCWCKTPEERKQCMSEIRRAKGIYKENKYGYGKQGKATHIKITKDNGEELIYNSINKCFQATGIDTRLIHKYIKDNELHYVRTLECNCIFKAIAE